jgi:hypothetical protein
VSDRSARIEVRNPLLGLPAARRIMRLPADQREALATLLRELSADAGERAEEAWRKKKGPMAAYWKAASVYAKHTARVLARPPETTAEAPEPLPLFPEIG